MSLFSSFFVPIGRLISVAADTHASIVHRPHDYLGIE